MTRRMLAEEKELRKWSIYINGEKNIDRFFREITALVRAVRENAAMVVENYKGHYGSNDPFVEGVVESLCDDISIAIRRKG